LAWSLHSSQAQFVFITVMVESIGEPQLAAHSGMLNIFHLVTCGMYGLSDAGASTVGMLLGKGESEQAKVRGGEERRTGGVKRQPLTTTAE